MPDLSQFRFSIPVALRYADIDALAHVNNVTYFAYLETARVNYLAEVLGWAGGWLDLGIIIARAECDYRLQLQWGDRVRVYLRAARLGNKSFDFAYVIARERDGQPPEVAAEARTVQVAYDYRREAAIPIPATWREQMIAYEPGLAVDG